MCLCVWMGHLCTDSLPSVCVCAQAVFAWMSDSWCEQTDSIGVCKWCAYAQTVCAQCVCKWSMCVVHT